MPVKPLLVVFVLLAGLRSASGATDSCLTPPPGAETVALAGVDEAGDPVLTDGRSLRLVGIAPRQDDAEAARFTEGLARLRGQELTLAPVGGSDRWGRQPARLLLPPETQGAAHRDVAGLLVEAGEARRLPEAALPGCGTPRRAAVRPAPDAAPKTPATPSPGVIDGHDVAALKAQAGRLVAIEGRIASVGERAQRSYLNFSRKRGEAGAVTMSRRLWREMQASGWTASGLSGKRLRASGVLSGQDGLLLEVTSADALELID